MVTLPVGDLDRAEKNEMKFAPVVRRIEFALCEGDKIRVLGTFSDRMPHG